MKNFLLATIFSFSIVLSPATVCDVQAAPPTIEYTLAESDPDTLALIVDSVPPGEQEEVPSVDSVKAEDLPELVTTLINAIKSKNWSLLTSAIIMLLVFLTNIILLKNLKGSTKKKVMPWVAIGVAAALQYAAALLVGDAWLPALNTAFVTGAGASGLWSLAGKTILGKFTS